MGRALGAVVDAGVRALDVRVGRCGESGVAVLAYENIPGSSYVSTRPVTCDPLIL